MTLKNLVKESRDFITDGIAWVAIWKEGRSWKYDYFYESDGSYDEGLVFDCDDMDRFETIASKDHKAICLNGYYMGFGQEDTLQEIENKILYFYLKRLNQLSGDFLDCMVIWSEGI